MANQRPTIAWGALRGGAWLFDGQRAANLIAIADDVVTSTEQVTDPTYAAYAEGVRDTLAWLTGSNPMPALTDLLDLEA